MTAHASKAAEGLLLRSARAASIAKGSPAAAAPLGFAAVLFRAQAGMAAALAAAHARAPLSGVLARDVAALIEPARALLASVAEAAPAPLAEDARARGREAADRFAERLSVYWSFDLGSADDYLSRAILRPYCATLAASSLKPDRAGTGASCPFCGGAPTVSARRPEGDALRRFLCCGLCGGEWPLNRIHCPACGEEEPARLPSFQSDSYPSARVEACDACKQYLKSIDLSNDGRLIPEVDELASLGLDLWAAEQGYTRIEPGLAGI